MPADLSDSPCHGGRSPPHAGTHSPGSAAPPAGEAAAAAAGGAAGPPASSPPEQGTAPPGTGPSYPHAEEGHQVNYPGPCSFLFIFITQTFALKQ